MKAALLTLAFAALGSVAWMCQRGGDGQSAEADIVIAGLGGFRGPVVRNPCFHYRGHGFNPFLGN